MHSAEVVKNRKKTLYNFSLVKYNAAITKPARREKRKGKPL